MKIEKQRIQIENIIKALLDARKKQFGPSSEITMVGQMHLFESTQELVPDYLALQVFHPTVLH
nr:hypothetical protein [uncultured Clostridium sp.]